ncbi:hypothetical protein ARMGADRAFT_1063944 [Armillaria gallica]|uniref:Uncharacterized protein n=1 Tax=Armillaria gallica TaxID=47427 RepID=A0A2H3D9Y0_ARMGA|nr:hypothetical protein ARMGADRAFT_1063944 [Armillaria gallica]
MCGKHPVISTNLVGSHANLGRRVRESAARIRNRLLNGNAPSLNLKLKLLHLNWRYTLLGQGPRGNTPNTFGPKSGLSRFATSHGSKVHAYPLAKHNPGPLDALGPKSRSPVAMSICPLNHSPIENQIGWFTCRLYQAQDYELHAPLNEPISYIGKPCRWFDPSFTLAYAGGAVFPTWHKSDFCKGKYSDFTPSGARGNFTGHLFALSVLIKAVLLEGGIATASHCVDRLHENLKAGAGNKQQGILLPRESN